MKEMKTLADIEPHVWVITPSGQHYCRDTMGGVVGAWPDLTHVWASTLAPREIEVDRVIGKIKDVNWEDTAAAV